jgi:outer membrane protease
MHILGAVLAAIAVALSAAPPAHAQDVTITGSTGAGVILGLAKEFVYSGSYVVSELDWPLLPAIAVNGTIDLATKIGFVASVEAQVAVPMASGTMTDSDFLNGDGVKTHYSQSSGNVASAFLLTTRAGWAIPLNTGYAITQLVPFIEFEYMQFKWTASGGYLQYPPEPYPGPYTPWSASEAKVPMYGTGIVYTQNYFIPAIGVKGSFRLTQSLTMDASFAFAPYLWCFDTDEHIFRLTTFYDDLHGGFMIEPRLATTLRITPAATLTLDALYRHISGLVGDTWAVGMGATGFPTVSQFPPGVQSSTSVNGAGASLDAVSISVNLSFTL